MVGALVLETAGHNATVDFEEDSIVVRFADLRSAIAMVGQPLPDLSLPGKLLKFAEIRLSVQLGNGRYMELFPKPHWIVKFLSPAIRTMISQA